MYNSNRNYLWFQNNPQQRNEGTLLTIGVVKAFINVYVA